MIEEVFESMEDSIKKALAALKSALSRIRTGRANAALLDSVRVHIDGKAADPVISRADFVRMAVNGVFPRPKPTAERLDTAVGQWVLTGEPVGAMGNSAIDKGGDTVGLYLELRRKGQPIDPNRWIASGKQNRTSG